MFDTLCRLALSDDNYEELANNLFQLFIEDGLTHLTTSDFLKLITIARENNALNNVKIIYLYASYNNIDAELQQLELLPEIQQHIDAPSNPEINSITMPEIVQVTYPESSSAAMLRDTVNLLKQTLNQCGIHPKNLRRDVVDEARKSLAQFFASKKGSNPFEAIGYKKDLCNLTQSIMLLKCTLIAWGVDASSLKTQAQVLLVANNNLKEQLNKNTQQEEEFTLNQVAQTLPNRMVTQSKPKHHVIELSAPEVSDPELSDTIQLRKAFRHLGQTLMKCGMPQEDRSIDIVDRTRNFLEELFAFSKNGSIPRLINLPKRQYQPTLVEQSNFQKIPVSCHTKGQRTNISTIKKLKCTLVGWGVDQSLLTTQLDILKVANESLEQQFAFYLEHTLPLDNALTMNQESTTLLDIMTHVKKPSTRLFSEISSNEDAQQGQSKKPKLVEAPVVIDLVSNDNLIAVIDPIEVNNQDIITQITTHEAITPDWQSEIEEWVLNLELEDPVQTQPIVPASSPNFFDNNSTYQNSWLTFYGAPLAEKQVGEIDFEIISHDKGQVLKFDCNNKCHFKI